MPTNVTAEYKKAEDAFRKARDPRERVPHPDTDKPFTVRRSTRSRTVT